MAHVADHIDTIAIGFERFGVAAGTMDSRKGNAIVTPAPVRNVRRERCFFVMNSIFRSPVYDLTFIFF